MKLVLDACVLYPNVMREMLLGAAKSGLFRPVWSARILEEWARAAARLSEVQALQARGEVALIKAAWPDAEHPPAPGLETRLWLPDSGDIHVLATAIDSSSDGIVTLNARDFPRGDLRAEGLERYDPDVLLRSYVDDAHDTILDVAQTVLQQANAGQGTWTLRGLLKKARLPRLGKALESKGAG